MTDGIIQQVFNEWREGIFEYMKEHKKTRFNKITDLKYDDIFSVLSMREQQLIEEIKQEIGECDTQFHTTHYNILRKLIGDNQE